MGLYCKFSIVPIFLAIFLIYLGLNKKNKKDFRLISFKRYFRYVKTIFNKKVLYIIIISAIITNSIVLYQNYRYENLYKDLDGTDIKITGVIEDKYKEMYTLKVITDGYKNTKLYLKFKNNIELEYGDNVYIYGKYNRPNSRTNFKGFDYKNYLKTLKIYGTVNVKTVKTISKNNGNILFKITFSLKQNIEKRIDNFQMKNEEKEILKGIILGEKEGISDDISKSFMLSNISYVLAVSGMHVSYLILFSKAIFNKLIGKHYSKIVTSIIIFIYMCITNFTPSVVRAGVVGIVFIMSNFFYRKSDTFNSLSMALVIIIAYNPFLIQNVGLQLSFAGTIGIILGLPQFNKIYESYISRNEKIAIRKNNKLKRFILKILNRKAFKALIQAIFVTISATIAVFPIMAIGFNTISISSLISSIISSFIIGPIVILGLICIAIRLDLLNSLLCCFIELLIKVARFGEILPLNQIYVITPDVVWVICYYIIVLLINYYLKLKFEKAPNSIQKRVKNLLNLFKYYIRINQKRIISSILIISIILCSLRFIPKELKIFFIDVGQGEASLIVTPKNQKILIDGGGIENSDFNVRRRSFNAIFIR